MKHYFEEKSRIQLSEFLEINLEKVNTEEKVNSFPMRDPVPRNWSALRFYNIMLVKEYSVDLVEFEKCKASPTAFPQTEQSMV